MQEYKKAYLQEVTNQIRNRRGKRLAEEELCGHIEDQTEAYIRDGMTPEAAEAEAVRQMGDPVSVGLELDHLYRPKPDWKLMALTAVLLLLGLLVQYGVSGSSAWFTRQLIETQIGIGVMVAAYFVDYTVVGKHSLWMWGGLTLLIGAEIVSQGMLFGSFRNGQYFVYPLLMLFVPLFAGVLYRMKGWGAGGVLLCEGIAAIAVFLAILSGSMTSVLELAAVFFCMLVGAVCRGWFRERRGKCLGVLLGSEVVIFGGFLLKALLSSGYRQQRILAAFHPEQFSESTGYQAVYARKLLAGVQLFGAGATGNLTAGDLNFADQGLLYVMVKYGLVAGLVIVALLVFLLARMFVVAFRQKNQLGSLLIFGTACLFFSETVIYLLYHMGFMLIMPKYLPFFSRAGWGIVSMCLLMGLVLSVFRNTNLVKETPEKPRQRYRLRIEKIVE